jgi:sugar (pentulose or hexulose) kinase
VGRFDGERLCLDVLHRFENGPVELNGRLYWDILGIYTQIRNSLVQLGQNGPVDLRTIGIDTWGCDFALLDRQGKLISNPYSYRDSHTAGIIPRLFSRMSRNDIFQITGLQFIEPNSLVQLFAMQSRQDPALQSARTFLHIGDLMHYWLTGVIACEYTNASTSQIMDARTHKWSPEIIEAFGLDPAIFPEIIPAGALLGKLRPALLSETGLEDVQLVATATHDTAAAILATPVESRPFAYVSSGTWALLGKEIENPILTQQCLADNIANEGGAFNKITLLKNIASLWLIQECRRQWSLQGKTFSWEELSAMSAEAPPFLAFLDPDDPIFLRPGDMPGRVQEYCRQSGQPVPQNKGEILRVIFESLAFKYRFVLERINSVTQEPTAVLHIIGGGSRNSLLNQFTANATSLPVQSGPAEATALGNILMQMVAVKELTALQEARDLVLRSFPTITFYPKDGERWDEQYPRFLKAASLVDIS